MSLVTKNIGFMKLFVACRKFMPHWPTPCLPAENIRVIFYLEPSPRVSPYLQIAKTCFEQNITTEVYCTIVMTQCCYL